MQAFPQLVPLPSPRVCAKNLAKARTHNAMNPATLVPDIQLFPSHLKMPLVQLPLTSSLITLPTGKVLLAPHPSLSIDELQGMGQVTDIVAPNLFHHLGIQQAVAAHPQAKLWGVAGFERKRKDIGWSAFMDDGSWPHQQELATVPLRGMPTINECVLVHQPSQTLFVTDLCFNILDSPGLGAWLIYHLFGTYQRFACSKLLMKRVVDRAAFEQSLARLFAHDFDRIVMCHGSVVRSGARAALQSALRERGFHIRQ